MIGFRMCVCIILQRILSNVIPCRTTTRCYNLRFPITLPWVFMYVLRSIYSIESSSPINGLVELICVNYEASIQQYWVDKVLIKLYWLLEWRRIEPGILNFRTHTMHKHNYNSFPLLSWCVRLIKNAANRLKSCAISIFLLQYTTSIRTMTM